MGKPYALIGHVLFDKGEAMIVVSLLYCLALFPNFVAFEDKKTIK